MMAEDGVNELAERLRDVSADLKNSIEAYTSIIDALLDIQEQYKNLQDDAREDPKSSSHEIEPCKKLPEELVVVFTGRLALLFHDTSA